MEVSQASRMARVSRNAYDPVLPYSRPIPEILESYQGACGSSLMPLITTRPARNWEATRRARLEVGSEDGAVKAVLGVVGDPDGILLGVIRDHAEHRGRKFFPGRSPCRLHVDETSVSRSNPPPGPPGVLSLRPGTSAPSSILCG